MKIEYIAGKQNTCADLLSRIPYREIDDDDIQADVAEPNEHFYGINVINSNRGDMNNQTSDTSSNSEANDKTNAESDSFDVGKEQDKDHQLLNLKKKILRNKENVKNYILENNELYFVDNKRDGVQRKCIPTHLFLLY